MTESPKRPNPSVISGQPNKNYPSRDSQNLHKQPNAKQPRSEDIVAAMVSKMDGFTAGLKEYKIRDLVEDTAKLGKELVIKGLKTNQIRKFLDAINRFKVEQNKQSGFSEKNRDELHILRYQLAYAAARQQKNKDPGPVEPLKKVLECAIKRVTDLEDFNRLVQLIESIVAYHKAAGGKDQ